MADQQISEISLPCLDLCRSEIYSTKLTTPPIGGYQEERSSVELIDISDIT